MKEKVDLAAQMMENKLLPTDYIYENIFHLSEDQYEEYYKGRKIFCINHVILFADIKIVLLEQEGKIK